MRPDVNSRPELVSEVVGRRVRLDRLASGSIFRLDDGTINTVIDATSLVESIIKVINEEGRVLFVHITTGELSALQGKELVEPQFLELVPARGRFE